MLVWHRLKQEVAAAEVEEVVAVEVGSVVAAVVAAWAVADEVLVVRA
jgi:hypothetical protein